MTFYVNSSVATLHNPGEGDTLLQIALGEVHRLGGRIKDYSKMTKHSFWVAGVLGILIPFFNGLQSDLWLWESLKKGWIDSFFIDFSWLIMGIISMFIAYFIKPKAHPGKLVKTNSSPAKNVSFNPEKSIHPKVLEPGAVVAMNTKK